MKQARVKCGGCGLRRVCRNLYHIKACEPCWFALVKGFNRVVKNHRKWLAKGGLVVKP